MKLYTCSNCHSLIYFENNICLNCKYSLGFDANTLSLITLVAEKNNIFANAQNKELKFRYCKNSEFSTCNWLIPASSNALYCQACDLNRIIPDLTNQENLKRWKNIEIAKHRLVYSLLRLRFRFKKRSEMKKPESHLISWLIHHPKKK